VLQRPHDARGLLRLREVEVRVHAHDDQVEPREPRLVEVEGAVLADVDLEAAQQRAGMSAPAAASSAAIASSSAHWRASFSASSPPVMRSACEWSVIAW
jgi:hypothetical protein